MFAYKLDYTITWRGRKNRNIAKVVKYLFFYHLGG